MLCVFIRLDNALFKFHNSTCTFDMLVRRIAPNHTGEQEPHSKKSYSLTVARDANGSIESACYSSPKPHHRGSLSHMQELHERQFVPKNNELLQAMQTNINEFHAQTDPGDAPNPWDIPTRLTPVECDVSNIPMASVMPQESSMDSKPKRFKTIYTFNIPESSGNSKAVIMARMNVEREDDPDDEDGLEVEDLEVGRDRDAASSMMPGKSPSVVRSVASGGHARGLSIGEQTGGSLPDTIHLKDPTTNDTHLYTYAGSTSPDKAADKVS
jgi:hypothetical protein